LQQRVWHSLLYATCYSSLNCMHVFVLICSYYYPTVWLSRRLLTKVGTTWLPKVL
jgi:hypothetical protein